MKETLIRIEVKNIDCDERLLRKKIREITEQEAVSEKETFILHGDTELFLKLRKLRIELFNDTGCSIVVTQV